MIAVRWRSVSLSTACCTRAALSRISNGHAGSCRDHREYPPLAVVPVARAGAVDRGTGSERPGRARSRTETCVGSCRPSETPADMPLGRRLQHLPGCRAFSGPAEYLVLVPANQFFQCNHIAASQSSHQLPIGGFSMFHRPPRSHPGACRCTQNTPTIRNRQLTLTLVRARWLQRVSGPVRLARRKREAGHPPAHRLFQHSWCVGHAP